MHHLDVCLDDQSAKFIFASFLIGRRISQKENASAKPYTRASEPFLFNWLFQRVVQIYFDKEQREL